MTGAAKTRATYADLDAVPEHLVAEIIDGELVTHPRPSPRHGMTAYALGSKLGDPFQFGGAGPGYSALNPSFILSRMLSFPTLRDGGVNACHAIPRPATSRFRRTGYARFCLLQQSYATGLPSRASMPTPAFRTSGS